VRRSSWIILFSAAILLLITTVLYSLTYAERAPGMSSAVAEEMVTSGRKAIERSDLNSFFDLFTEDAMVLGRPR